MQCGSPRSAVFVRELIVQASIPLIFTENYVAASLSVSEERLRRIRRLYRNAYAVISVCEENRALLRRRFGLYSARHVVIRYGVHAPRRPRERGRKRPYVRALTVARLTSQKGIDVLIRAVAALGQEVRRKFRFTVAGDGELESSLKALAAALSVANEIDFIGWSDEVQTLLRESDLFILPSIAEGQPISLLEAMSFGLPCIASSVSGIPEALADGRYGTLVPPNDPVSLSAAISAFACAPAELQGKAAAAVAHIRREHDPATNMGQVIALWQEAVSVRRGTASDEISDG